MTPEHSTSRSEAPDATDSTAPERGTPPNRGIVPDTVIEEPVSTYPLDAASLMPKMMAKWFWDTYDGLWRWAAMNLGVFFLGSIWGFGVYAALNPLLQAGPDASLLVRFFLSAVVFGVIAIPINAFALSWMMPFARGFTHYTEPEFRWPFRGLRHFGRFFALSLSQALINFFLIFNILFYATQAWRPVALHWGGLILAGLFFWFWLGANAMILYCAPMIAEERWGWKDMIRRAAFIVVVHKWFTVALLMMTSAIWLLGIQIRLMGLALFCHALTMTLINAAYQTVADFHRAKEALSELNENADAIKPKTWKEKKELEERGVLALLGGKVQPTRYQRSLKDMIRPWD